MVDFPDRLADHTARPSSFYQSLLFSKGALPTSSLRDYYFEQSYGALEVTGETFGWYTYPESYYATFDDGNFGGSGGALGVAYAALLMADPDVDFADFDSDGPDGVANSGDDDGYVDACLVIYSGLGGHDTLNPSDIWAVIMPPEYETDDPAAVGGYIQIDRVSLQPERSLGFPPTDTLDTFIGVFAHEYGHLLGLGDLYQKGPTWGIGYWGLMGYGAKGARKTGPYDLGAYCKALLGWITPTVVTSSMLNVAIPPVETNPVAYKVWRNGTPDQEYFLIENREPLLHDQELPGSGLLIWHINEAETGANAPPTVAPFPARTPVYDFFIGLEQADGLNDMNTYFERPVPDDYYHEMGDSGDPFPGDSLRTAFDQFSYPSSLDDAGNSTGVSIENISLLGQDVHADIRIEPLSVLFTDFNARPVERGVQLAWHVFADEPLQGFRLYRQEGESGRYDAIAQTDELGAGARDYLDVRVRDGARYSYVLAAVLSDGSELRSPPASVTLAQRSPQLLQNAPNPFFPSTRISFYLPRAEHMTLTVFRVDGTRVRTILDADVPAGQGQVWWDGRDDGGDLVGSGLYFYRMRAGKHTVAKKMVLMH